MRAVLVLVALAVALPALAVDRDALQAYALPAVEAVASSDLVELGRLLYFDRRLSGDGTMNCATCHLPDEGFADGRDVSAAYPTNAHFRNTPTVVNAALRPRLTWDGRAASVEEQALGPIGSPFEMNIQLDLLEEKLRGVPEYREAFRKALGTEVSRKGMARALGAFERTVLADPSPFDRYAAGDDGALSAEALRGLELFFGKAGCIGCHTGPHFGAEGFASLGLPPNPRVAAEPLRAVSLRFFARTQGETLPLGSEDDWGRGFVTGVPEDRGTFLVPTLRQLARTAPYGHDGRFPTLGEVVALLDAGGGSAPHRSRELRPLGLTEAERDALVAFLLALTGDDPVVRPPRLPGG
ncbi:MAG TPA: cytochrome c peroxidase [Deferrisomatales bacterium]|nr:cytochrome c peroxidase [Deferrisomatales bacterium]